MSLLKKAPGQGLNSSMQGFEKKMLLKKIGEMTDIPTPNVHITKIVQQLRRDDVDMRALAEAIQKDQALVAKILKMINSGFYGLKQTISSVDQAIGLLGITTIKQLVYSASIMDVFTKDEKAEWDHAYSTSVLMTNLMKENQLPAASNLPMTMLMHDLGKVVLRRFNPKKYKMVISMCQEDNSPIFEKEEALFQVNHAEAAALLMEKWEMSEDVLKPILLHHSQTLPEEFVLECALVQFVNWVDCMARAIPCPPPSKKLMDAAGFEGVDRAFWVRYQKDLIRLIEKENAAG